jgi:hypothetical protein
MTTKKMINICAKTLSELMYWKLKQGKTTDEAFQLTKKQLMKQTGCKEIVAVNLIRMSMGIYLGEKEYVEKSLNSLVSNGVD